jgi:polysaccharide biosynthesis/export protein
MLMSTIVKLVVFFLLLTACAPTIQNAVTADYARSQAPTAPLKEYLIQPGDQLDVKFFYNPELNEPLLTVRPDGRISLQLAPEIMAAGLTPAQLTAVLTKSYAAELANPGISVIIRSFSAQRVYVDGEVNRPGMVNLTGQMTILQSIAEAGGFKDSARKNEVVIIRKVADKKPLTIVANLEDAQYGADKNQDITLVPYDIIYVPKSKISNVNQFVDLYIRKNIPIPFGFSYGLGAN